MAALTFGHANIIAGWLTMVLGILSGAIIGLWAFAGPFPTPKGHTNYTDLSRRMVRLGHIALIALPMINILYGQYIDSIPVSDSLKMLGSRGMIVCMIGVPLFLDRLINLIHDRQKGYSLSHSSFIINILSRIFLSPYLFVFF